MQGLKMKVLNVLALHLHSVDFVKMIVGFNEKYKQC